jgi:hypothetical protein
VSVHVVHLVVHVSNIVVSVRVKSGVLWQISGVAVGHVTVVGKPVCHAPHAVGDGLGDSVADSLADGLDGITLQVLKGGVGWNDTVRVTVGHAVGVTVAHLGLSSLLELYVLEVFFDDVLEVLLNRNRVGIAVHLLIRIRFKRFV